MGCWAGEGVLEVEGRENMLRRPGIEARFVEARRVEYWASWENDEVDFLGSREE